MITLLIFKKGVATMGRIINRTNRIADTVKNAVDNRSLIIMQTNTMNSRFGNTED